jgi:hypothetical protein
MHKLQLVTTCLAASIAAVTLAGCGGSNSSTSTPTPPVTASLSGTYVLSANGNDGTDGLYDVAGVLKFDGSGHITGVADYNLGSGIDMNVPLTGTYTLAGTAALVTLTDGAGLQDTFTLAISSSGPSTVAGFDGSGSGTLTPQTATSFATSGTYTYSLSGQGNNALTSTGGFTVTAGTITAGTQTDTDGAVVSNYSSITGILEPVQADGRGQAAIGPYTFSYYPVTANQIVLIGLDDRALLYGTAQKM